MRRDPKAFRERFKAWKNGLLVYDNGRPITDDEYAGIMEKVAIENNPKWNKIRQEEGGNILSEDLELVRILNDNTYDYRGYYNKYPNSRANADTHWTDEFKTAYHPTFSTDSKYSGKKSQYNPEGVLGGHWDGEKYIPAWGLKLPSYYKTYSNGKDALRGFEGGKDEDDVTTLRELTVTPNGSYAPVSPDDMKFNLEQAVDARISKDRKDRYTLLRNMNTAQEVGAATIGGALASIVGDPVGYSLIKGGASLLNVAKNLPLFARRVWNGGNIIQRNIPYNPYNFYREVGKDAIVDAKKTGLIRGNPRLEVNHPYFGRSISPWQRKKYVIEGYPESSDWISAYKYIYDGENGAPKIELLSKYPNRDFSKGYATKIGEPQSNGFLRIGGFDAEFLNEYEAFPYYNGSTIVPTTKFTYWLKHPIIGWRNHSFASHGSNIPYASQWDLTNAYANAKAYADSPLRAQLFELLKKEAADAGYISLNSLLLLGRMHSKKPLIRFEDLGPDIFGKYLSDKHQILLNVTDPNPLTPYHEYLHSLDVGRPFKDSFTLTKKYKQLKRKATKFGDQEAAKEMMRYADDAYGMDDFYTHKANQIIESSADPYYKDPLEIDAYGLQEGKRLSMPIFSPKPSDEVLQRMYQQSLNGPYGHFFKHLKVGDNTLDTYWKLLSGLFLPFGIGGAYIMNQNYKNGKDAIPKTTGGAGYIPDINLSEVVLNSIRKRFYDTIGARWSYDIPFALRAFIYGIKKDKDNPEDSPEADALLATYLNIPIEQRVYKNQLTKSKYKPTNAKFTDDYYTVNLSDRDKEKLVDDAFGFKKEYVGTDGLYPIIKKVRPGYEYDSLGNLLWNTVPLSNGEYKKSRVLANHNLGTHRISRGFDKKGDYIAYSDSWDINPFHGTNARDNVGFLARLIGLNKKNNISDYLGTPVKFYDRLYLDDYYKLPPNGSTYLPEITVTPDKSYKNGKDSGIYIKPENRGKFTALKKRTGHSASWFKVHGTPALKKMATFELNSKKWHRN